MSKKLHTISVKGSQHTWTFEVYVDPQYLEEWRDDGLEIHETENSIPGWVQSCGASATRVWCFLQDCFHFKNPLR